VGSWRTTAFAIESLRHVGVASHLAVDGHSLASQILKKLLRRPIQFTPVREAGERYYRFKAPIALDGLIAGTVGAIIVASPPGLTPFRVSRYQMVGVVRRAA